MLSFINGEEFTFVDEISIQNTFPLFSPSSFESFFSHTKKFDSASVNDDNDSFTSALIEKNTALIDNHLNNSNINRSNDDNLPSSSVDASDESMVNNDWRVYDYAVNDSIPSIDHSSFPSSSSSSFLYDQSFTQIPSDHHHHQHESDSFPSLRRRHQYLIGPESKVCRRRRASRSPLHHSLQNAIHKAIGSNPRHLSRLQNHKSITSLKGYQSNKSYGSSRMGCMCASSDESSSRTEREERALKMNTQRGPYDQEKHNADEEEEEVMMVEKSNNNQTKSKKVKGWQAVLQARSEAKARRNLLDARRQFFARKRKAENHSSATRRPALRYINKHSSSSTPSTSSSHHSSSSSSSPALDDSFFFGIKDWETFRRKFYFLHRHAIHDALVPNRGTRVAAIRFAPVRDSVTRNFLSRLYGRSPSLSFHGTHYHNMQSILDKGLLIPNAKNGVTVVNGSAYGVGIYSSKTAGYSLSYSRGVSTMFICAVIEGDDAVKTHGNIVVAHSEDLIIPVFLLDFEFVGNSSSDANQSSLGKYSTIGRNDWAEIRKQVNKRRTQNKNDNRRLKESTMNGRSSSNASDHDMNIIRQFEELFLSTDDQQ